MPAFSATELAKWSGGEWTPAEPEMIDGVSNDSRSINGGNLYFALKGEKFDGHNFVQEAFEKGASGAVVSRRQLAETKGQLEKYSARGEQVKSAMPQGSISRQHAPPMLDRQSTMDLPLLCVDDPKKALRDIASAYRLKVDPEIVAITGSAGKSTVREMTVQILSGTMKTASTYGNWNNDIGLPLSLLAMEKSTRIGIFEVASNHPGDITDLCDMLKPNWGVVTNVGSAHREFFESVEAIAHEKACLLKSLPPDSVAVLNRDGSFFEFLSSMSPAEIITISATGDADYVCSKRDPIKKEAIIEERSTGDRFVLRTRFPGEYSVINSLFAIAVTRRHGVDWEQITAALESYTLLPMRWERKKINGINIINDAYNANPLSMRASIKAFGEERVEGRKWLVLGGMLEMGDQEVNEHLRLGEWIGHCAMLDPSYGKEGEQLDLRIDGGLIVVGLLGKMIAEGAENAGYRRLTVFYCENTKEAAETITENVSTGDAVFLKASRGIRLENIIGALL